MLVLPVLIVMTDRTITKVRFLPGADVLAWRLSGRVLQVPGASVFHSSPEAMHVNTKDPRSIVVSIVLYPTWQ